MKRSALAGAAIAALLTTISASAQAQSVDHNDYSKPENWVCQGTAGKCLGDQGTTRIDAAGATAPEAFEATAKPPIDCFYVYPTASDDPTPNSDMIPGRELMVVQTQFGRFASVCRTFAPMYRSVTLADLRSRTAGNPSKGDRAMAARDVDDAFDWYMAHENKGRGVVLIGHSQGAGELIRLIKAKVDAKPAQKQIVSAILLGATVQVQPGKDVGGDFQSMPICRRDGQFGCVVVYASYRDTAPPPPGYIGESKAPTVAACANPAALSGGKAALDSYMARANVEWIPGRTADTPFVHVPGLFAGECVERDGYAFLAITVAPDAGDKRTRNVPGELKKASGEVDRAWGFHVVDPSLAQGDLIRMVKRQGEAWAKAR